MPDRPLYQWDHHSDQPHVISDKQAKRRLYRLGAIGSLKTLIVSLLALPAAWLVKRLQAPATLPFSASEIGLCVNIESDLAEKTSLGTQQLVEAISELGATSLLIRIPLAKSAQLQPYLDLADQLSGYSLLFDILQDRKHIENPDLLRADLRNIFSQFGKFSQQFKIGNAVNRRKWAFTSLDEYFRFFATAQQIRDAEFPGLKLLGGGIIDFELPNFARSVLHLAPISYDGVAALLYVDRRGAPENRQLAANLQDKIGWFYALMQLSRKTVKDLHITETNWPLVGTEPFAPAVGSCMVDENRQAAYLARYYLLALATGRVRSVYWHQLVAPGYGLIDNRGTSPRKRRAFYAFRTLNQLLSQAEITGFDQNDGLFILGARKGRQKITAIWTNDEEREFNIDKLQVLSASSAPDSIEIVNLAGERIAPASKLKVSGDVTYFIQQLASG